MMSKRKREDTTAAGSADDNRDRRAKRQRVRKRSHSEPLRNDAVPAEKRDMLRRLFGRICAVDLEENQRPASEPEEDLLTEEDENSLEEDVPADMVPEQLGFLVCAQETLRYLNKVGITSQNPVFYELRRRLLQGISEIRVA